MIENEIKEFVSNSIEQIRLTSTKDFLLTGNIDFDISLVTVKEKNGRIGIHIAGVGGSSSIQQVHRVHFSITDKKSLENNIQLFKKVLKKLLPEFSKFERFEKEVDGK